ncbi:MAG TPA: hypothetical protein VJ180_10000 [Pyrinomonadaceae bacterium]|nr:hypothetical protein [Pyrinomonadaceae bacterium]
MYAYLANTSHFQPGRQTQAQTVFGWLRQKLEARRARLTQSSEIRCLRDLDRSTLEDMGLDVARFGETRPSLASFNPHVIAINIFAR